MWLQYTTRRMTEALSRSIHNTLAYFDLFDFPLTREELFRFLWRPPKASYEEFVVLLPRCPGVEERFGHYFLPGRADILNRRRASALTSEFKTRRAQRAVRLLSFVPFLQGVFVCNSVGSETALPESDIDLFIVAAPRHLWSVRLFSNLILKLFGLRVSRRRTRDRMCLSFFVDADHLNLRALSVAPDDVYLVYWLQQLTPLYDRGGIIEKLYQANRWIYDCVPYAEPIRQDDRQIVPGRLAKLWAKVWEAMWQGAYGTVVEGQMKALQLMKLPLDVQRSAERDDKNVVISDGILKFHETDARRGFREAWLKRVFL